jgi:hypothetical protein
VSQLGSRRDLDLLRVQLLEEVEAPYKAKCEAIAKVCLPAVLNCYAQVPILFETASKHVNTWL